MFPLVTKVNFRNATQSAKTQQQVRGITSSMREPLFNAPHLEGPVSLPDKLETTILAGGVKVHSVDRASPITTLSVYVKAGTRYETPQTTTACSFLKHLALKGTNEKSAIRLVRDLEHIGATFQSIVSRDYISYHINTLRFPSNKPSAVNLQIAAESLRFILNPLLLEYEVERVRPLVTRDAEQHHSNLKLRVIELAHSEAFRDSGLSRPLYPSTEYIKSITNRLLHHHISTYYYPGDRIKVVGTGIAHDELVDKLKPLFSSPSLQGKYRELKKFTTPLSIDADTQSGATAFVGSGISVRVTSPGDLTHVALAFPGFSVTSKDHVALSVLAEILGGGISGLSGPGNCYRYSSRIFQKIVDSNPSVKEASVFHSAYSDAGIFGIYLSVGDGKGKEVVSAVRDVLKETINTVSEEELQKGQRGVVNRLLRSVAGNGLGVTELVATVGKTEQEFVSTVQSVTLGDVLSVAKTVFAITPVLAAIGDVRGIPRIN